MDFNSPVPPPLFHISHEDYRTAPPLAPITAQDLRPKLKIKFDSPIPQAHSRLPANHLTVKSGLNIQQRVQQPQSSNTLLLTQKVGKKAIPTKPSLITLTKGAREKEKHPRPSPLISLRITK